MKWTTLILLTAASTSLLSAQDLDFSEAGRIVIQSGGRKKPLETYANETMQMLSGQGSLRDPATGQQMAALPWVLSIWFSARDWKNDPLILVADVELRKTLGLPAQTRRVSYRALAENSLFAELARNVGAKARQRQELTPSEKEMENVLQRLQLLKQLASGEAFRILPHPTLAKSDWSDPKNAGQIYTPELTARIGAALEAMTRALRARSRDDFTSHSFELREALAQASPAAYPTPRQINREIHYNHLRPLRWAWILYLTAFFVALWPKARPAGLALLGAGLTFHIYGFVLRCLISGRAPVTNMYESVVWVSLGVALFAFIFEIIYGARVHLLVAAPLAVAGLILADSLPSVLNPNLGPLPPVLRDNFWLVTHVLTITLGYAAFALAMGLGHVILAREFFKPIPAGATASYHQLLYRILQIGVLLLAAGTILGGVWANYSWGRFWGWDPKETWALIALLLYIFALHGRLAGWWSHFGLSVAAVLCFNGVLMAWYGVNFVLGKGLHSYGFGGGGVPWMVALVGLDLLFVVVCVLAHRRSPGTPSPELNLHPANPTRVDAAPIASTPRRAALFRLP